jgi:hypothetical protein
MVRTDDTVEIHCNTVCAAVKAAVGQSGGRAKRRTGGQTAKAAVNYA